MRSQSDNISALKLLEKVQRNILSEDELKLLAEECRSSYYRFFLEFWDIVNNKKLIDNWHIKALCDEAQKIATCVINRKPKEYDLLVNIAPSETKTNIFTVGLQPWIWTIAPWVTVISASVNHQLSVKNSKNTKRIIESQKYKSMFKNFELSYGSKAVKSFSNNKGGARYTTSINSKIIGVHGDILSWDDLHDRKLANNKTQMKEVVDYFKFDFTTRITDRTKVPVIGVAQRLGVNDISAELLRQRDEEGLKIKHYCLPSTDRYPIYPQKFIKFYTDGYMNPYRTGKNEIDKEIVRLGQAGFDAQFGQQPVTIEGSLVKRRWISIMNYSDLPNDVQKSTKHMVFDTAFTSKIENDPTAYIVFSVVKGYVFLFEFRKQWYETHYVEKLVEKKVKEWGTPQTKVYMEPKANGETIIQNLQRKGDINIIRYKMPKGDKEDRLKGVVSYIEAGRLIVVKAQGHETYISDLVSFPKSIHKEAADLTSMMLTQGLIRDINYEGELRN